MDFLGKLYDPINRARVNWRQKLADVADYVGGHNQSIPDIGADKALHQATSRNLTGGLGKLLPPMLSANISDAAGLANESASGALQKATGRDFFSPNGFDFEDVANNRRGQELGMQDIEREGTNPYLKALQMGTGMEGLDTIARGINKFGLPW